MSHSRRAKDANSWTTLRRARPARIGPSSAPAPSSTAAPISNLLLGDELAAAVAASEPRGDLTRSAVVPLTADRAVARAGAWYEMMPRSQGPLAGPSTARSTTASRGCPTSPRSVSTCSISRRSIRSAAPTARAATTRSRRSPAIPAAPMPSAAPRAATTRSTPSSARSTISGAWSQPAATHGLEIALDFAIQCSPDHPWLREHPGLVQAAARRLDPVCREPAEEIRGHRQPRFLLRGPRLRCGRRCATSCCSGSSRACASFASTTRTPSRSHSGNG